MRPDTNWQTFRTCSPKVSCRSYLTSKEIGRAILNIYCPSMVMLVCQAVSVQFRLKKAVLHLDELTVNLALADHVTTLSSSGCKDATIISIFWALQAINELSTLALTKILSSNSARRSFM